MYWTPCLHTHLGYGIDDPNDNDVAAAGRLKNETYFASVLWDLNPTFRIGLEFAWRETEYRLLRNEGPESTHNSSGRFETHWVQG